MRNPSEKPTNHHSTRTLIGLVLLTLSCAATDKTIKEEPAKPASTVEKKSKKESCADQLKEAMGLCVDMCRMRKIGEIGDEFDKNGCDKKCENGTSKYPTKLRGLYEKCGKKLKKNEITPKKDKVSPKRDHRKRRRRSGRVA